jgi:hypothetical protein
LRAVALQDLVGHGWPYVSDDRTTGDERRRATKRWRFHGEAGAPVSRRPPPPSGRARRAHMRRRTFLVIVFGWVSVVVTLAAVILAIRWFG